MANRTISDLFRQTNEVKLVDYRRNSSLMQANVSIHWWDTLPTSLHCHNYYEFFIITNGRIRHILNGTESEMQKNTLCLIRPADCHQFRPISGVFCTHLNVAFTTEKFETMCHALSIDPAALTSAAEPLSLKLDDSEASFYISGAMQSGLLNRENTPTQEGVFLASSLIARALSALYSRNTMGVLRAPEWFTRFLQRIHSSEWIDCSANDVYRLSGYSPPAIIRCFKTYTGKTIVAYLTDLKMSHACNMLLNTTCSTLEIAGRLGYDSLSHFNRLFKQHVGKTPKEYRQAALPFSEALSAGAD